jgi:glutathione reductase (NADPH)
VWGAFGGMGGISELPHPEHLHHLAFTIPPIASVGVGEKQAREQGLKFRTHHRKASDWYTARRVAETVYGFKVLRR